jgi:hypothetical protein
MTPDRTNTPTTTNRKRFIFIGTLTIKISS